MSRTFHIVAERAAVRCDICHQTDEFDLATGTCRRCAGLALSRLVQYESAPVALHPRPLPRDEWALRRLQRQIFWVLPTSIVLFLSGLLTAFFLFDEADPFPLVTTLFSVVFYFMFLSALALGVLSGVFCLVRFIFLYFPGIGLFFRDLRESVASNFR